jgi:hypothetical protein
MRRRLEKCAVALDDKKVNPDVAIDKTIAAAIGRRLEGGLLPCAAAGALAAELGCEPFAVGATADALRITITACQLGLFGYPGHAKGWEATGVAAQPVPAGLEAALLAASDGRGELTCLAVWQVAERTGCGRMQAGYIADRLGIKIRSCLLGAF